MNTWIILAAICVCATAQQYRPPQRLNTNEQTARVLKLDYDLSPDGSYRWSHETENGISAQEQGRLGTSSHSQQPGTEAQGSFQYTAPDGQVISVQYVADENGFQPQGAHLPTPPPIPEAIVRSIEWNNAHPEQPGLGRRVVQF